MPSKKGKGIDKDTDKTKNNAGTALQLFTNEEFGHIRKGVKDGKPYVVAIDLGEMLGLSNIREYLRLLDDDEKDAVRIPDGMGRLQSTAVVYQSGVWALTFRSNKPDAKRIRKWVTSEVLPSVVEQLVAYFHQHRMPTMDELQQTPYTVREILLATLQEQKLLDQQIEELQPAKILYHAMVDADGMYSVDELHKVLLNAGVKIAYKDFHKELSDDKFQFKGENGYKAYLKYTRRGWMTTKFVWKNGKMSSSAKFTNIGFRGVFAFYVEKHKGVNAVKGYQLTLDDCNKKLPSLTLSGSDGSHKTEKP